MKQTISGYLYKLRLLKQNSFVVLIENSKINDLNKLNKFFLLETQYPEKRQEFINLILVRQVELNIKYSKFSNKKRMKDITKLYLRLFNVSTFK